MGDGARPEDRRRDREYTEDGRGAFSPHAFVGAEDDWHGGSCATSARKMLTPARTFAWDLDEDLPGGGRSWGGGGGWGGPRRVCGG